MRKLVLKMSLSADGFVGGPKGEVAWLFESLDDEMTKWEVDLLWNAGVHIMGSRTFADMKAYWPTSDEPFAPPMNEIPKVVFSRKGIPAATTSALQETTRLRNERGGRALPAKTASWDEARVVTGDLAEVLRRMKQEPGKDILAHGGASFAQSLVKTGLIDEYVLVVHPVALGSGLALFPPMPEPLHLRLSGTTSFPAGAVVNIYRPR